MIPPVTTDRLQRTRRIQRGQGAVQYVLVVAVIAVVVLGVLQVVGRRTSTPYCSVNQGLQKGAACPGQTQFTNLVANPKLDIDARGYLAGCYGTACATISRARITSDAPPGASASYEAIFNPGTASPNSQIYFGASSLAFGSKVSEGQVVSMSAQVKIASGPPGTTVSMMADYTGNTASPQCGSVWAYNSPYLATMTDQGVWQLLQNTFTVDPGKTCAAVDIITGAIGGNVTLRISQLSIVVSDTIIPYFDGDSLNGTWTGTPGASTSTGWVTTG